MYSANIDIDSVHTLKARRTDTHVHALVRTQSKLQNTKST